MKLFFYKFLKIICDVIAFNAIVLWLWPYLGFVALVVGVVFGLFYSYVLSRLYITPILQLPSDPRISDAGSIHFTALHDVEFKSNEREFMLHTGESVHIKIKETCSRIELKYTREIPDSILDAKELDI